MKTREHKNMKAIEQFMFLCFYVFMFFLGGFLLISPFNLAWAVAPPDIKIDIGGFNKDSFKAVEPVSCSDQSGQTCLEISWIGDYISAIYRYGLGLAAILAVVMIMVGGFLWLTSGGNQNQVSRAKEFIVSALTGLLLALFSFMILSTVNPRLVDLEPLIVSKPEEEVVSSKTETGAFPKDSQVEDITTNIYQECDTNRDLQTFDCYSIFGGARNYQDFGGGEFYFEIPVQGSGEEILTAIGRNETVLNLLSARRGLSFEEALNGDSYDWGGLTFRYNGTNLNNRFWEVRESTSIFPRY